MNNLVPAAPRTFADVELVPLQREIAPATPIEQLLAGLYRQRYVVIAAFFIPLIIAAALAYILPRNFTAVASVQLDQQVPRVVPDNDLDPDISTQDAARFLQTQLDRVRSRNLAEMVDNRLKIEKSPHLMSALDIDPTNPGIVYQIKNLLGLAQPFNVRGAVISALMAGVNPEAGLNTRLAQINFTSHDPNVSAEIANAYASSLVSSNIDSKLQTSAQAKQYLQAQLTNAKLNLENSEKSMLAYARSADLTTTVMQTNDPKDEKIASLRDQQLGTMTDSLSQATARRIDAEQSWNQVRNTSPMLLPDVQSNQAIQNLVSQRAEAEASLKEERQHHTENYPSVREAEAKINELDGQIAGFAASIKSAYFGRYLAAAKQEQQLTSTVGSLKGAAMSERERAVRFNALSREVETASAFYDGLLQRYKDVAAASGVPSVNVTIIDRAWPPTQADAGLARNVALGGMSGLVLALMFGAIRERMHRVIRSPEDLERAFNLRSLGVVPKIGKREDLNEALEDPHSAQSEAYYSIAAALELTGPGGLPKSLLITSSVPSEGKSTSAFGIARSLSAMGKRVVLMDGDLRRPESTKFAGQPGTPALSEILAGAAPAQKIVAGSEGAGLSVIPAGTPNCNPVALLAATGTKDVFDKLASTYDILIIDGPPVMGLADAVLLARSVEAVLLVVEANKTHTSELDIALSRLPEEAVIGAVITKFHPRTAGVRYGGSEYYTYRSRD